MTEIDPDDLRRLVRLVEDDDLSELRYEQGDLRIVLRSAAYPMHRAASRGVFAASAAPITPLFTGETGFADALPLSAEAGEAALFPPENQITIEAPVMGVFYRSSSPEEPTFVEVGDSVEVGQTVGLIEAMKVFSEIKSEVAGTVIELPGRNGALVQPGDPLVVLEEA